MVAEALEDVDLIGELDDVGIGSPGEHEGGDQSREREEGSQDE